jgi:hypothetical protein
VVPFTPSHIAAALPFVRTPLPIAPLVIGTMAPDVPYFLPIRVPRDLTHSLAGVPTIDLAITIVLVLLWYAVLRAPIIDLLPGVLRERIPGTGPFGWRRPDRSWRSAIVLGILAALVGILTHLAWDAFTHQSSPLVQAVPALHARLGPLQVSSWLQHASTIGGLIALAVWAPLWFRRTAPDAARATRATARGRAAAWFAVVLAFGGTGLAVWIAFIAAGYPPFAPSPVFVAVTAAGGVARLVGLVVCAIWWIRRALRAGRTSATTTL